MQRQSLAGYESDLLYPKIIHNIARENVINKMNNEINSKIIILYS